MAHAPRPGVGARADATAEARKTMTITVRRAQREDGTPIAESHTFAPNLVPFSERNLLRKETGLPLSAYVGEHTFDADSLLVLWWLARRANGETFLTLKRAERQFPDDLTEDDVEVETDDGLEAVEDDDPEGSGPVS